MTSGMKLTKVLLFTLTLQPIFGASVEEHGRIKKKPRTAAEAERIASERVKDDSSRGSAKDRIKNEFLPVPNPLSSAKK
jgi:hypothetical protein